ncbi:hypothetical protein BVX97_05990 [bacterium E08(2017)]|nr:hypothetical protein BVX97_05990 [bacterium E08(2017)]
MSNQTADTFEQGFMSRSLEEQIEQCDQYELAPLFLELFKDRSPVLEAGCGSGRWCAWLHKHSIQSDGIDWSQTLCERASKEIPTSKFVACDVRNTPFDDKSYGGILALGTVEHIIEGPVSALSEFNRLLKDDGAALITVPYGGSLRILIRTLNKPLRFFKSIPLVRRIFGLKSGSSSLASAIKTARPEWHPRFSHGDEGWFFFEYEFNKKQMRTFLDEAGFKVDKEIVCFRDAGIFHTFGRISGKWNTAKGGVDFSPLGRILKAIVPAESVGHMVCHVVSKKKAES